MDLEFYKKQKHSFFLDPFKQYSREPSEDEKEFFEEFLEEAVEDIAEVTGCSADFKLYYAMTDEDSLEDDLPINRYVHGFSFAGWMEGFDRDVVMIRSVKDRENWRDCLVNMLAHEMAHQEFYNKTQNAPYTNLENLIFEGNAMNRAEQVTGELGVDWQPGYRSDERLGIAAEEIMDILDEDRSYEPSSIFENGEAPCEGAEGYRISYLVVKNIVGSSGISLDDVASISGEDARERVENGLISVLN